MPIGEKSSNFPFAIRMFIGSPQWGQSEPICEPPRRMAVIRVSYEQKVKTLSDLPTAIQSFVGTSLLPITASFDLTRLRNSLVPECFALFFSLQQPEEISRIPRSSFKAVDSHQSVAQFGVEGCRSRPFADYSMQQLRLPPQQVW